MSSLPESAAAARPAAGIDPRGPRFTAAIMSVLLLAVVFLGVAGARVAATVLLAVVVVTFAWAAAAGVRRHPLGWLFRVALRPRLAAPGDLEDPAAPRFAQVVGFVVTGAGLLLGLLGVPVAVPVAAGAAFVAAFLNAAFGYCIGCQLYVLLVRARSGGRRADPAS